MLRGRGGRTGGEIKFNSCGKKREREERVGNKLNAFSLVMEGDYLCLVLQPSQELYFSDVCILNGLLDISKVNFFQCKNLVVFTDDLKYLEIGMNMQSLLSVSVCLSLPPFLHPSLLPCLILLFLTDTAF